MAKRKTLEDRKAKARADLARPRTAYQAAVEKRDRWLADAAREERLTRARREKRPERDAPTLCGPESSYVQPPRHVLVEAMKPPVTHR